MHSDLEPMTYREDFRKKYVVKGPQHCTWRARERARTVKDVLGLRLGLPHKVCMCMRVCAYGCAYGLYVCIYECMHAYVGFGLGTRVCVFVCKRVYVNG